MNWTTQTLLATDFWLISTFLFSLLVGSFLNVVILRSPTIMLREYTRNALEFLKDNPLKASGFKLSVDAEHESMRELHRPYSIIAPRSHCPKCNRMIRAIENIPIISYIALRGRCKGCSVSIPLRYPLIEFITAVLTTFIVWKVSFCSDAITNNPFEIRLGMAALAALFTWALIALTVIDLDTQYLPDSITLPLIWLGLISNLTPYGFAPSIEAAVLGAAIGYLSLWSIYQLFKALTGKEGMGFGDFKLLAVLGAWLGWNALPSIILLSSLLGTIVGVGLMIAKKHGREVPIAFGPYLAVAGMIALLWGNHILRAIYGPALPAGL